MIDVHCHLQFKAFENDYGQVIKQAFDAGITKIINTGTQLSSSRKAIELAEKYEDLYAIVGVHPHHADKIQQNPQVVEHTENPQENFVETPPDPDYWLHELERLTKHPKVIGIGEIGLDYYSYKSNGIVDPQQQKKVFEKQIQLAHKVGLPLQIHNRHAGSEVLNLLKHHKKLLQKAPGMFHCFAGDRQTLQEALELGFYLGFDGNITYKGLAPGETVTLSELAKETPLDRIVIETDSPYLSPVPHRGKRNEPQYLPVTATFIAQLKDISVEELVEQTEKNVYTVFNL